jgi:hypothetical protein
MHRGIEALAKWLPTKDCWTCPQAEMERLRSEMDKLEEARLSAEAMAARLEKEAELPVRVRQSARETSPRMANICQS